MANFSPEPPYVAVMDAVLRRIVYGVCAFAALLIALQLLSG